MKNLYKAAIVLVLLSFTVIGANAQTEVQQRVERYLYANYNANKASLRENDRIIRALEERFDIYTDELDATTKSKVAFQEAEIKEYLSGVEKVRDVKLLTQMVEEAHQNNRIKLNLYLNEGLKSAEDALECRKIIIMKLAEHKLIRQKQEKLLVLLKNDQSRDAFIQALLKKGKLKEESDLKSFAQVVDLEVFGFGI